MSPNRTTIVRSRQYYQQPLAEPLLDRAPEARPATSSVPAGHGRREAVRAVGLASRLILNSVSIFVLCGVFGLAVLATAPQLLGFGTVVVGSGSMEPSLRLADVVVLADPTERRVAQGSVINYEVDGHDTRIHRVIEIVPDGYTTKGDANRSPDSGIVAPEAVDGIGIYVVPFIGWPHQWLTEGHWLELIASTAAVWLLASTERAAFVDRPQPRTDSQLGPVTVHRRQKPVTT